jgi:hypothetical protein
MLGNGSTQRLSDCVFMLTRSGLVVSTVTAFGTHKKVLGRLALHVRLFQYLRLEQTRTPPEQEKGGVGEDAHHREIGKGSCNTN